MTPHTSHLVFAAAMSALLAPTTLAQITPGNLVVVRSGDGTGALTNAATAAFLDEFTVAGAPVQSIALPTTASLPNLQATLTGNATSEGFLTQSTDGNYLVCAGYAANLATPNIATTGSAVNARVIARIALNGTIDTTTSISNLFSAGNIRSASTEDGSQFWSAGSNSGVVLSTLAGTTGLLVSSAVTNLRVTNIANGQLFATSGAGVATRAIMTVGTGLPTTVGQPMTVLNGMASGTASPYDYWFADAQTVYVADDRAALSGGGIQKWTESAGTWTLAYTLSPGTGCRGLSGITDLGGTTLFATTTQSSANQLVSVLDTGIGAAFTTLATAVANTAFRGVRFVREPAAISFGGAPCPTSAGVPTIGTTGGAPVSGNANFALTLGNAPASTIFITAIGINSVLSPFGFNVPDAPPCALVYFPPILLFIGTADGAGNGVMPLSLAPADAALWGLDVPVQHAVFDLTGFYAGFGLPVGMTTGMQLNIGN